MNRIIIFTLLFLILLSSVISAHPGRTDGSGGHNGPDGYHYHHGHPAHDHTDLDGDGELDCPYGYKDNTKNNSGSGNNNNNNNSADSKTEPTQLSPLVIYLIVFVSCAVILITIRIIFRKSEKVETAFLHIVGQYLCIASYISILAAMTSVIWFIVVCVIILTVIELFFEPFRIICATVLPTLSMIASLFCQDNDVVYILSITAFFTLIGMFIYNLESTSKHLH